jgi:hypothetical protein
MEIDRRKTYRFPLTVEHGKMVTFFPVGFGGRIKTAVTGEIYNLSEEGLNGLIHAKTRKRKKWWVVFDFPGALRGGRAQCKVVRAEKDPLGTHVGLQFVSLPPVALAALKKMAYGYRVCEAGLAFAMADVCRRDCGYFPLCRKPAKLRDDSAPLG